MPAGESKTRRVSIEATARSSSLSMSELSIRQRRARYRGQSGGKTELPCARQTLKNCFEIGGESTSPGACLQSTYSRYSRGSKRAQPYRCVRRASNGVACEGRSAGACWSRGVLPMFAACSPRVEGHRDGARLPTLTFEALGPSRSPCQQPQAANPRSRARSRYCQTLVNVLRWRTFTM